MQLTDLGAVLKRRDLFAIVGSAALFQSLLAEAQVSSNRALLVWFGSGALSSASSYIGFLKEALEELGDREGREFDFLSRFAEYKVERLPALAAEVVNLKPTAIFVGATDTAVAAKRATSTIPIVCAALADPIELGLIVRRQSF
jgi:putative tryptophan/tyrosine transport system substrate-binding protein